MKDRELVLDVVQRMREAEQEAKRSHLGPEWRSYWNGRARAFDEVYTELKGRGYDGKA